LVTDQPGTNDPAAQSRIKIRLAKSKDTEISPPVASKQPKFDVPLSSTPAKRPTPLQIPTSSRTVPSVPVTRFAGSGRPRRTYAPDRDDEAPRSGWTEDDKDLFFLALAKHGRDFDAISNELKRDRTQCRNFYYRERSKRGGKPFPEEATAPPPPSRKRKHERKSSRSRKGDDESESDGGGGGGESGDESSGESALEQEGAELVIIPGMTDSQVKCLKVRE
jgi:hypothetical protein